MIIIHPHRHCPYYFLTCPKALFAHNDFLNDFLKEMCVVDPAEKVPVKAVWDVYRQWCEEQGEDPAQGRTFNHMNGRARLRAKTGSCLWRQW